MLTTVGASNVTGITQSGGFTNGQSATVNINGSGNTTAITQSGISTDNVANYLGAGSGNTVGITQLGN